MGYSTDSRGRLCCDNCGEVGARRRPCLFKVRGVPYCPADALCPACYSAADHKARHAGCKAGAARAEAEYAAKDAALFEGAYLLRAGWGDWHLNVRSGFVGAMFVAIDGREVYLEVPVAEYRDRGSAFVVTSDTFAGAEPWCGPAAGAVLKCRHGVGGDVGRECLMEDRRRPRGGQFVPYCRSLAVGLGVAV